MDARLQRMLRAHKAEAGDLKTHAALLSAAVRAGLLEKEKVLLCAFIGHHAARLMLVDEAKRDGVVHKGRKLQNLEIKDLAANITKWGKDASRRAAYAIAGLCLEAIKKSNMGGTAFIATAEQTLDIVHSLINGSTTDDSKLWQNIRNMHTMRTNALPTRRDPLVNHERILFGFFVDFAAHGTHLGILKAATAWIDDKKIEKALQKEIYPWALGEFI